jgi:hypothetical protein
MVKSAKLFAVVVVALLAATFSPGPDRAHAQNLTVNVPGLTVVNVAEIIQDQVPGLTTTNVFTVPAGQLLVITDVVISNDSGNAACCQRIFRGGTAATAFFAVSPQSSFSHTFATGIIFTAGQTVAVRNGTSTAGDTHFYLRGYLVNF